MTEKNDAMAAEVLALNRSGMMLVEIASRYGFTKERARQLRNRGLEIERNPPVGIEYELTPRTRNALIGWGITPKPDIVAKYFENNATELLRVCNMGAKSIKELNEWLARHGQKEISQ